MKLKEGVVGFVRVLLGQVPEIVKAEMTKPLAAFFGVFDINGSGEVDAGELKKFLTVVNPAESDDASAYCKALLSILDVDDSGSLGSTDLVKFGLKMVAVAFALAQAALGSVERILSVPNAKKLLKLVEGALVDLPDEMMEDLSAMGIKQPKQYLIEGIKTSDVEPIIKKIIS